MIQRIQTVYLLVATVLMALSLIMPIAVFQVSGAEFELGAFSLHNDAVAYYNPVVWMGIILSAATMLPLVTIFLFKRRTLQIRLCAVEAVLLLGSLAFMAIFYFCSDTIFDGFDVQNEYFGMGAIMPVLSLILVVLAARAIFKDEVLVRSLDRIR